MAHDWWRISVIFDSGRKPNALTPKWIFFIPISNSQTWKYALFCMLVNWPIAKFGCQCHPSTKTWALPDISCQMDSSWRKLPLSTHNAQYFTTSSLYANYRHSPITQNRYWVLRLWVIRALHNQSQPVNGTQNTSYIFKLHIPRLEQCRQSFWFWTARLVNLTPPEIQFLKTDGLKQRLLKYSWNYFQQYFNSESPCTWKLFCDCTLNNCRNKLTYISIYLLYLGTKTHPLHWC